MAFVTRTVDSVSTSKHSKQFSLSSKTKPRMIYDGVQWGIGGRGTSLADGMAHGMQDNTRVLLSSIELPDDPILQYSIYSSPSSDPLAPLESLRRKLAQSSLQQPIFSSPITRIHFQSAHPLLYIFHVASAGHPTSAAMTLDDPTCELNTPHADFR
jgi:hypothetical protein